MTRVYRLDVTYPPGTEPGSGWAPPDYEPPDFYDEDATRPWTWPRNKLFLSASGARARAELFRQYGATVVIVPSWPVIWPPETDQ